MHLHLFAPLPHYPTFCVGMNVGAAFVGAVTDGHTNIQDNRGVARARPFPGRRGPLPLGIQDGRKVLAIADLA
jgi:hypothetical protein